MVITLIIIGVLIAYAISIYNGLATKSVQVKEARSNIETLLKKRFDLIPNIVNTVKGYAKHEKDLFNEVARLRSAATNTSSLKDLADIDAKMTKTLKGIFAVAENYPELKANANFLDLQEKLGSLETEIQKSRKFYNAIVSEFNAAIIRFPANIFANMFGFKPAEFFKASEEEQKNVEVKF